MYKQYIHVQYVRNVCAPQKQKQRISKLKNSKQRTASPTMPQPKRSHGIGYKTAKKKIKHHCPTDPKYKKLWLQWLLPLYRTESLPPITTESTPMQPKLAASQDIHILIKMYYMHILDSPPPSEWNGRDGIVTVIQQQLEIPNGSHNTILNVLENVFECNSMGNEYGGQRVLGGG